MTERLSGNTPTDSLAPIELDRITIEEEAAFMNRGKGTSLTAIAGVLSAAVLCGAVLLRSMDREQAFAKSGDTVRALAAEHFDGYFQCSIPEKLRAPIDSSEKLAQQLERVADTLGRSYGATLQRCESRLDPLVAGLESMQVPVELQAQRAKLVAASKSFQSSVGALRQRLATVEQYSYAAIATEIDRVTKAWDGFQTARSELLAAIDAR